MSESSAGAAGTAASIKLAGVHHVTIRVQDPARTRQFWTDVVGLQFMEIPVNNEVTKIWRGAPSSGVLTATQIGTSFLVFAPPLEGVGSNSRFDEHNIGMDHIGFAVQDRAELDSLVQRLRGAGVQTEGVEHDPVLDKDYVAFRDPDNLQVEAYMV